MSLNVEQIPNRIGYYLAGFADGEGSFNVVFRKRKDYAMPWKVSVCFNVSQRGESVLLLFQEHLRCGTMRQRADGIWYYEVNSLTDATEHVVPFFERFGFLSNKKKRDFAKFEHITRLMNRKQHLCRRHPADSRNPIRDERRRRWATEVFRRRDYERVRARILRDYTLSFSKAYRATPLAFEHDDIVRSLWRHRGHISTCHALFREGATLTNGPKVNTIALALVKPDHMRETPH